MFEYRLGRTPRHRHGRADRDRAEGAARRAAHGRPVDDQAAPHGVRVPGPVPGGDARSRDGRPQEAGRRHDRAGEELRRFRSDRRRAHASSKARSSRSRAQSPTSRPKPPERRRRRGRAAGGGPAAHAERALRRRRARTRRRRRCAGRRRADALPSELEAAGPAAEPPSPMREASPHEPRGRRDEIEATKAPLMEHLIELRSRLIKALVAFAVTFVVCFFFAERHLQHPDLAVRLGGRGRRTPSSSTPRCSNISDQAQARDVRRGVHLVPGGRQPDLHVRGARPLPARARRRSCPISSRRRSSSRSAPRSSISCVMPLLVRFSLGMQQLGGEGEAEIELLAQGRRISRPDDVADLRLRHRVPAAGDPDAARAHRHPHLATAAREAALFHRRRLRDRRGPHPARRDQPAVARRAADGALRGLDLVGAAGREEGGAPPRPSRRRHRRTPTRRNDPGTSGSIVAMPSLPGIRRLEAVVNDSSIAAA